MDIADHIRLKTARLLLPKLYPVLRQQFPQALWGGNPHLRQVALTFDDGPHPGDTPQLLEVLARHQVSATFFFLGTRVEAYRQLVLQVAQAGHHIGSHGYFHRPFLFEPPERLQQQLSVAQALIAQSAQRALIEVRDLRPPYGLALPDVLQRLIAWNYRPVMATILPLHWLQSEELSIAEVMSQVRPGSLIVLHEDKTGGPPVAQLTDHVLTRLKDAGFELITIDQMWQSLAGAEAE
ncbi:MAG: polysaccharide deacetylase family protein [Chloroflexaceae bacterium]|nr:polysaccharide deacetylase family protein [Chloroflexaceae bacterium]